MWAGEHPASPYFRSLRSGSRRSVRRRLSRSHTFGSASGPRHQSDRRPKSQLVETRRRTRRLAPSRQSSSRSPQFYGLAAVFRGVRLDEMTSEDFAAVLRQDPVVIVPIGALEEHGRHLPLGSDMIQPLHVVDEVARRTGALVAPQIPYGVCTTTRPYPGTVSVSVDSLQLYVRDVLGDFVRNGISRVMILSGHAGREHMMALRAAAQEVVDGASGLKATVLSDYDIIYASKGILPEGDGHAGAGETSRILTARPDLVKGTSPPGKNEIPPYAVVADPRKYWSGVTGDPSMASNALGKKLDDLVIEELVKLVQELRRRK